MSKLFEVSIQVIGDDKSTEQQIQKQVEDKLGSLKISEVFVRSADYMGDIDDLDEIEPEIGDLE